MSKRPRYPLEALVEQRKSVVDERGRDLADERARTMQAEAQAARAAEEKRRHDEAAARLRAAERAELDGGQLRAQDLAQAGGWEHATEQERLAREAQREQAAQALAEQRNAEDHARGALALADADAEAVLKHREGWDDARRRASDRAEEESAEEAWLARRFNGARRNT